MTSVFCNPIGFYKTSEVCVLLKICRQTLYRYKKTCGFPLPAIFVTGGENRYSISEVHAWIRENNELVARAAVAGRNIRTRLVRREKPVRPDQRLQLSEDHIVTDLI